MSFRIGQKVVYVGGAKTPGAWCPQGCGKLVVGHTYTIREIDPIYIVHFGSAGIRVHESIDEKVMWSGRLIEPAALAHKFRPLIERRTDISIFTEMLKTDRVPALSKA